MKKSKQPSKTGTLLHASFRDPAGFVYRDEHGVFLRQINPEGLEDLALLESSGLYKELVKDKLLVSHKVIHRDAQGAKIQPEQIPFISYPYEWSFTQLKDAALLTLDIQRRALAKGLTLKDASAYNVQFLHGVPIFIDTLSFEAHTPDTPWQAYRQFCEHFLAPLALMSYVDVRLSQMLRTYLDGIPLDLAAKLLPRRAKLRPSIAMHIGLHARAQQAKATEHKKQTAALSQTGLDAILGNLQRTIAGMRPHKAVTEWGDYYDKTNYTTDAADQKAKLIRSFVKPLGAKTAVDLGGNDGRYSRALHGLGIATVCTDIDPIAVEANYRFMRHSQETKMLPLLVDLTNPGGAMGWYNKERPPIHERIHTDVVMVLALIHHLAISNNLPLEKLAEYFAEFAPHLVIEFVPKQDSQVQKLLSTREDIFPNYTEEGLKRAFKHVYVLEKEEPIKGSNRTLYLFRRK